MEAPVVTVLMEGSWLRGGGLKVCLVQGLGVDVAAAVEDRSRPGTLATLTDLLSTRGMPAMYRLLLGPGPALLVLPELALGSGDWKAVDSLVRSFPTPLLLVTGFGYTRAEDLQAWLDEPVPEPDTRRVAGWHTPLIPGNRYNGGWCWIHIPSRPTRCVAFLKRFLEQRHEAASRLNLAFGNEILRIEGRDLVLFPLICADLVCEQDASPRELVHEALEDAPPGSAQVVVAGLLADRRPAHVKWYEAITEVTRPVTPALQPTLLVANHASGQVFREGDEDRWRCLTGLFQYTGRNPRPARQDGVPSGQPTPVVRRFLRTVQERTFRGQVLRSTDPGVVAGRIAWDLGPATQLEPWGQARYQPIGPDGHLEPDPDLSPEAFELTRFLSRRLPTSQEQECGVQRLSLEGKDRLATAASHWASDLVRETCEKVLWGLFWNSPSAHAGPGRLSMDALDQEPLATNLAEGLEVLGLLQLTGSLDPVPEWGQEGQWCYLEPGPRDTPTRLLVWNDRGVHRVTVQGALSGWTAQGGPPCHLVVLARGRGTMQWRSDISDARDPGPSRDITAPASRTAVLHPLDAVDDLLATAGDTLLAQLRRLLKELKDPLLPQEPKKEADHG